MPKLSPEARAARQNMTPLQTTAFEIYFSMEGKRSYAKTGKAIARSEKTIENWSRKFRWQELILKRQEEYGLRSRQATDADLMNRRKTLLNIWQGMLLKCVRTITGPDGRPHQEISIEPRDVADLERITKQILLLSGDVTERTEYVSTIINRVLNVVDTEIKNPDLRFRIYQRLGGVLTDGGGTPADDAAAARPGDRAQTKT